MTSSNPRPGGIDANSRGIAVLVVAVVVGFLLLLNAGGSGATSDTASDDGPSTTVDISGVNDDPAATTTLPGEVEGPTTTEDTETDTSEPDRQPGDVTVAVLNGGGPAGAAGAVSATIVDRGYQAGTVGNTSPGVAQLDTTKVYYAEGYQAEASAVAGLLGKADDAVEALPDPPPGAGIESANVVVVLGKDTPPVGADPTASTVPG
ncbi:MAG: LytR C-terminal domain-containing protein [Aquihabitans sp.]